VTSPFIDPDFDPESDTDLDQQSWSTPDLPRDVSGDAAPADGRPPAESRPVDPPKPMMPRDRGWRVGHPPQAIPVRRDELDDWDDAAREMQRSTRQDLDPVFGYIMVMALSVGLTPIQANLRYVVLWTLMALMGGMAFLIGSGIKLKVTDPRDLMWGIGLGLFTGGALMLVGADTLATTSRRLFNDGQPDSALLDTWVFQAMVFVMPVAESLFFRGAMQRVHPIPVVALLASIWSMLMFFPNLGLGETPVVGIVFGTALVLLNFLYSYVNWQHGLAASFFCQITAGTMLLLVPRLMTF
jgi:membrane protease YdiL (CAAX protease family)